MQVAVENMIKGAWFVCESQDTLLSTTTCGKKCRDNNATTGTKTQNCRKMLNDEDFQWYNIFIIFTLLLQNYTEAASPWTISEG